MADEPCNCEHTNHFDDDRGPRTQHKHMDILAGPKRALYIGLVCNQCAATCVADYIITPECPNPWHKTSHFRSTRLCAECE